VKEILRVHIDGASAGNPGRCGIGYLIYRGDECLKKGSVSLGIQTNNFAEYMALIFALVDVLGMGAKSCQVYSDSQLLCEQINGNYKVKNDNIKPLFTLAKQMISHLSEFKISHVGREANSDADELAKKATEFLV
jgi:ribonuclease HI